MTRPGGIIGDDARRELRALDSERGCVVPEWGSPAFAVAEEDLDSADVVGGDPGHDPALVPGTGESQLSSSGPRSNNASGLGIRRRTRLDRQVRRRWRPPGLRVRAAAEHATTRGSCRRSQRRESRRERGRRFARSPCSSPCGGLAVRAETPRGSQLTTQPIVPPVTSRPTVAGPRARKPVRNEGWPLTLTESGTVWARRSGPHEQPPCPPGLVEMSGRGHDRGRQAWAE